MLNLCISTQLILPKLHHQTKIQFQNSIQTRSCVLLGDHRQTLIQTTAYVSR